MVPQPETGRPVAHRPTQEALRSLDATADDRAREVLSALVGHLHAFVSEVGLTPDEWQRAVEFLTATGQACTADRQEFILLSDVLGISSLVESQAGAQDAEATEATVLGPFHVSESPVRALGDALFPDLPAAGPPCLVSGTVRTVSGAPLPGATVDVWQADAGGWYDVQRPDLREPGDGRGLFTADDQGRFRFRTVVPSPYPIPTDGPVGDLLRLTGREVHRPAHIHFRVRAEGCRPLTTHLFPAGDPHLGSDPVFAVRDGLVREFEVVADPQAARRAGLPVPFHSVAFDLVLEPTV